MRKGIGVREHSNNHQFFFSIVDFVWFIASSSDETSFCFLFGFLYVCGRIYMGEGIKGEENGLDRRDKHRFSARI